MAIKYHTEEERKAARLASNRKYRLSQKGTEDEKKRTAARTKRRRKRKAEAVAERGSVCVKTVMGHSMTLVLTSTIPIQRKKR